MLMGDFTIFPAIDLRQGKVVRLTQGDPARQSIYGNEPAAFARRWLEDGAHWLHVVNLDGAFGEGSSENLDALKAIAAEAARAKQPGKVQFGGGIRSLYEAEEAISLGVDRVVLGTAAVENPALLERALRQFGFERIALALDVHEGEVRVRGWQQGICVDPASLGMRFAGLGGKTAIYTDVSRDGMGTGLNVKAAKQLAEQCQLSVIASGGFDNEKDVRRARLSGLDGVIIGKALYQGRVDLKEILSC
jgi:phosphoribosylformimino-5-aminoimidazole carboxamide ribotide isomerase